VVLGLFLCVLRQPSYYLAKVPLNGVSGARDYSGMSIFSHSGRLRRVRARGLLQLLINVRDLSDART